MAVQRKTFVKARQSYDNREEDFYRQQVEDSINDIAEELKRVASSTDQRTSITMKRSLGFFSKNYGTRSV